MQRRNRKIPDVLEEGFIDTSQDYLLRHDEGPTFTSVVQLDELEMFSTCKAAAEFGVLATLAKLVMGGHPIEDDFQKVANLIIAKSLLRGKLPEQSKGRPKLRGGVDGRLVAEIYIERMEGGAKSDDAAAELALLFYKTERHILRLVKENRVAVVSMKVLKRECPEFCVNGASVKDSTSIHAGRRPSFKRFHI